MRNFRQYDIWLQSVDFATEVYKLTEIFPNVEKYSLTDQIRRAAVSIASNVAEGCSRESEKEFYHYVQVAIGSAFEIETQFKIALNVNYISKEQYDAIILPLDKLERQLNKLHSVLKSSIYKNK